MSARTQAYVWSTITNWDYTSTVDIRMKFYYPFTAILSDIIINQNINEPLPIALKTSIKARCLVTRAEVDNL